MKLNQPRWLALFIVTALLEGCSSTRDVPIPAQGRSWAGAKVQNITTADYIGRQVTIGTFVPACPPLRGIPRCLAIGLRDADRAPRSEDDGAGTVPGYGPNQLQAAYDIGSAALANPGGLVAVIEAGGDPHLAKDLAMYRRQFSLPPCTKQSGCLQIVNQTGQLSPLPPVADGWLAEQSLDVDMVSANCPNCHILVVEASTDLYIAEKTAKAFGPVAISNSWGFAEYSSELDDQQKYFDLPGIAITASAGDGGVGVIFPSTAATVTSVGGTSLRRARNARGWSERVWDATGSGCSVYIPETTWQAPIEQELGGCVLSGGRRIVNDVAYDADPNTGVAVYESIAGDGLKPGWQVWGGTSVGAPAMAAIYALSGNTAGVPAALAYANADNLYDVTIGSNGTCSPLYLCTGQAGYDGPTGLGTAHGLGAF